MDNPENLAIIQDEVKQNKNTTQYAINLTSQNAIFT
jgi:hypothetical protein